PDPVVGEIIIGNRSVSGSSIASLTDLPGFNSNNEVFFEPNIVFAEGLDVRANAHGNWIDGSVTARAEAQLYGHDLTISPALFGIVDVTATADESYGTKDGGVHASAQFVAAGSAFHVSGTTTDLINALVFYSGNITLGAEEIFIDTAVTVTAFADPIGGQG